MALSLIAGVALATTPTPEPETTTGPGYGMMRGQGTMNGQGGQMRSKGMRGGQNQDCLMNGGGQRMGSKGMMHGKRGMHNGGKMMNPEMAEKRDKFLDSTVELRKQLHDKQFAYKEATRNPAMTQGELKNQQKELYTMRQELQTKRQAFFTAK